MHSIVDEKYSISSCIYLFSFLLILAQAANSQEILWSTPGVGERPSLSVQGSTLADQLVIISSPFGNQVKVVKLADGSQSWKKKILERVPYATLALNDVLVVQGDQGTIWALRKEDGEQLWEGRTPEPLDYPMAAPRFRESGVFSISRRGKIRRLVRDGGESGSVIRDMSWGDRIADIVPLRTKQKELSYLDQAGRLTFYDPVTLQLQQTATLASDPSRADVVSGAVSEDGKLAWAVELPARLFGMNIEAGRPMWSRRLGDDLQLWSGEDQLVAVPFMLSWNEQPAILLATFGRASVYDGQSGKVLTSVELPSPAVAPPVFESAHDRWWILCERDLVSLQGGEWSTHRLDIADKPYTVAVAQESLLIGSFDGRVYRMTTSARGLPLSPRK